MPYQPAPFFRRLAARLLDLAFCLVLTFAVAVPMALVLLVLSPALALTADGSAHDLGYAAAGLCYFVAYVGLEVFLLVRREGQTLGKGLMGLRVVASSDRSPAGLGLPAALARMLIIFLPFVLMSLSGGNPDSAPLDTLALLGALSLLASLVLAAVPSKGRRTVHDLAVGSRVVRASRRKVDWKRDARMIVPDRVDLAKRL